MSKFVHLHLHSEYSLQDGLVRIPDLMQSLPKLGMNAVALTDQNNLFAAVKFYQAALSAGIKPIIGAEIQYENPDNTELTYPLVLLCQNTKGYHNLTSLISKAYLEGQHLGEVRVQRDWLKDHAEGLIALSGGLKGDIGQALLADKRAAAEHLAADWLSLFGDRFYLEIQRSNRADESQYNERLVTLAEGLQIPLVASNDVRFLQEEDYEAHEARVCIHEGYSLADPRRQKPYSQAQYLKSATEMEALFADIPQALQNSVEIAKRCNLTLNLGKNYLPNFPVPANFTVAEFLSQLSKMGLEQRLMQIFKADSDKIKAKREAYDQRLEIELNVINTMGFAGYFLIVADFIQWAKENEVPVGPGRGSGAGSLVAYALKITDLDPLQYDLLFERFLNPERVSMPDFDVDFCMEGRDRVIDYVAQKYGRQAVSQIITFGTMAAKAVVRDVGRVLGHPYGFVDKLAKLVPFEIGITLEKALEQEPELKSRYEDEEEVRELINLALKLEGIARNAGKHAGGVVIAPSTLTDFTAIYCEPGSEQLVSQFDKDDVEAVGLVKFDFLGLRTLTIIHWAIQTINEQRAQQALEPIDISQIPLDDEPSYQILKKCQTTAVFQLESRGMKELIHRLQPDCFEEIIALVALFRPGPLQSGMVDDFIDRKHGRAKVEYPHPDLEPILSPTYGVILYQEQVMQIAQVLASYSLGAADMLRRAMGKKKPEEMAKQRAIFVEGALARGVAEDTATHIFDQMEKFAGYGFNKSHSAAYALIAYQTAWLKAHYPAAFMAAVLSSDMDNTDKVVIFIEEAKRMRLPILPPDINQSSYRFTVGDANTLVYGLGAIKGVGEAAIEGLLDNRKQLGPFENLFDCCKRLDLRKLNRRVLEALIKAGALDSFGQDRAVLFASLDKAMQMASKEQQAAASGQIDLFSLLEEGSKADYQEAKPWPLAEKLNYEKETLGYFLSGHPSQPYSEEFGSKITALASLPQSKQKKALLCGLIKGLRRVLTKRGKALLILNLEDQTGLFDIVVFSEVEEASGLSLQSGQLLLINGDLSPDSYSGGVKVLASELYSLEQARTRFAKFIEISLSAEQDQENLFYLKPILKNHPGDCPVQIQYQNPKASTCLQLPKDWSVSPSTGLLEKLADLLGEQRVKLLY